MAGESMAEIFARLNAGQGAATGSDVYLGTKSQTTPVGTRKPFLMGESKTTKVDSTSTILEAKNSFYNWSDKYLNSFVNRLGSYGYKNVSRIQAKQLWDMAVDGASSWYLGSNKSRKVTPEQYLQWNSKSTGGGQENLPLKQVYLYDDATVKGLINDTLDNVLGRKATADENKQFFGKVKKMMNEGTVNTTETKVVGGRKMRVSTTKPGFSREAASAAIEKDIKTGTASQQADYKQKKSLDFADFLSKLEG